MPIEGDGFAVSPSDLTFDSVARQVAARRGGGDVRLLRRGVNHVYEANDAVIRVSATAEDALRHVEIAREVAALGIPGPVPLEDATSLEGLGVTIWQRVEPAQGELVNYERVGEVIAVLHACRVERLRRRVRLPWCGEPASLQLDDVLAEIGRRGLLDDEDLTILQSECGQRRDWHERARRDGALVACHGDLHPNNIIQTANGPVILDWDGLCLGPPAWDHALLLSWPSRWGGHPDTYRDFARGSGSDLRTSPLARVLTETRLLAVTLNMVLAGEHDSQRAEEACRRLRYWRRETNAPPWRPQ